MIDPFALTTEYARAVFPQQPIAGPFTANLGGFLTSCLYGLAGIRIGAGEPKSWCARPVTLPKGWAELHVDRVWARGRPLKLTALSSTTHPGDLTSVQSLSATVFCFRRRTAFVVCF